MGVYDMGQLQSGIILRVCVTLTYICVSVKVSSYPYSALPYILAERKGMVFRKVHLRPGFGWTL
jgi:hypothetical protein